MLLVRAADSEVEVWREGVETRVLTSARTGARQLAVFEQLCAPGRGAPSHLHAVEEVLRIVEGRALVWVAEQREELAAGDAVIIPAGVVHGFTNSGDTPLRILAILAAPVFEAHYLDPPRDSRRWLPEIL